MELLPPEILWRTKEAFSDGVSTTTSSWYQIIQKKAKLITGEEDLAKAEQKYYDHLFHKKYGNRKRLKKVMPYKWLPRFIEATDASARTLPIYNASYANIRQYK